MYLYRNVAPAAYTGKYPNNTHPNRLNSKLCGLGSSIRNWESVYERQFQAKHTYISRTVYRGRVMMNSASSEAKPLQPDIKQALKLAQHADGNSAETHIGYSTMNAVYLSHSSFGGNVLIEAPA